MSSAGRTFVPISIDELKQKIQTVWAKHPDYTEDTKDDYLLRFQELTPQVIRDLGKVSFSTENLEYENGKGYSNSGSITGYHRLDNGLAFLGISAGGDWELPLFFIIYWDGKRLRGYIPTDGNPWNTDTHMAYGNDGDARAGSVSDWKNAKKRFPDRIKDEQEPEWFDTGDVDIECDPKKIIADITARITQK